MLNLSFYHLILQKTSFQTYVFVLLVVSSLLWLLVGLVGLRVHTPHALSPLPIDDAVLLFTGQRERQKVQKEEQDKDQQAVQVNNYLFQVNNKL